MTAEAMTQQSKYTVVTAKVGGGLVLVPRKP
jgi:hypothetical protein